MKRFVNSFGTLVKRNPIVILFIILFAAECAFVPYFGTRANLINLLDQRANIAIMSLALTFVLVCGEMDLSMANTACLTGLISVMCITNLGMNTATAILIAVALGALLGAVNGFFIAKVNVNSFVMTLITELLYGGIALVISNSKTQTGVPADYIAITRTKILNLPLSIWLMAMVFVVGGIVLHKTAYGRKLFAVGSSPKTANLSGVSISKTLFSIYVLSGVCAAIAGVLLVSRSAAASPSPGTTVMTDVIAGTVAGGCSLLGGKGTVIGTFFGMLTLSILTNAIDLLGLSFNATLLIKGSVIALALLTAYFQTKLDEKLMLART